MTYEMMFFYGEVAGFSGIITFLGIKLSKRHLVLGNFLARRRDSL